MIKQASQKLSKHKAWRYCLYVFTYLVMVPVLYTFLLVVNPLKSAVLAAVLTVLELWDDLKIEFATFKHILEAEKRNK